MNPNSYGLAVIDGPSTFMSGVSRSFRYTDEDLRKALLNAASQLKRIVVEHRPKNIIILHGGEEDLLDGRLRDAYQSWKDIAEAMGIPQHASSRLDTYAIARDLAKSVEGEKRATLIVSDDSLFGVFLGETIFFEAVEQRDPRVYSKNDFVATHGFSPSLIPHFFALSGHVQSGMKGIPVVGPRSAATWLCDFGQSEKELSEFIRNSYGHTKAGAAFVRHFSLYHSNLEKIKALLARKVPLIPDAAPNRLKLSALFDHFDRGDVNRHRNEINSILEKSELYEMIPASTPKQFRSHVTRLSAISAINSLRRSGTLSFYLEKGDGASNYLGIGVSDGKSNHGFLIEGSEDITQDWLSDKIQELISRRDVKVVANDAKEFYNFTDYQGSLSADVKTMAYSIDTSMGKKDFVDIVNLIAPSLDFNRAPYSQVYSKGEVEAGAYLAERSFLALTANRRLYESAKKSRALEIYKSIEEPVARVLAKMEKNGVLIDKNAISLAKIDIEHEMKSIVDLVNKSLPYEENVQDLSAKNIERILYDIFKIQPPKVTQSGMRSVSTEALELIKDIHWLPEKLIRYKSLSDTLARSITPILSRISGKNNYLYPTYNHCKTITSRLSASDPNIQAVPIRTEEGKKIRRSFVAREGYSIVAADYSQIELRVLAHRSQDPTLLSIFRSGGDVHTGTAAKVFAVRYEDVTPEQRRAAKSINFGIIYGLTPFGLAKRLGVGEGEAKSFIKKYFDTFSGVKKHLDETIQMGLKNGYVESCSGRKLPLFRPDGVTTKHERELMARRCCNYPMQATAAEIIKRAMIAVAHEIDEKFDYAKLFMQVHDELVFSVKNSELEQFVEWCREKMEGAAELSVPLSIDIDSGKNWEVSHSPDAKQGAKDRDMEVSSFEMK